MDGSWCSNHSAKKMSQWCMSQVFDYLIQYVTLCDEINCVGKIWCRPFERYIDHFIPISSSWDMDQSFNIGTSLGRFFDSLYKEDEREPWGVRLYIGYGYLAEEVTSLDLPLLFCRISLFAWPATFIRTSSDLHILIYFPLW